MKTVSSREAFTLIELMIVVAILGVLAAIAIPSFVGYLRRAKVAEAYDVLKSLYNNAATYYMRENYAPGLNSVQSRSCSVPSSDNKVAPGDSKKYGDYSDSGFRALEFTQHASYFRFELVNGYDAAGGCSVPPSTPVYSLRARGDLDGDGTQSLFELAIGSDAENELYHAPGFYISNETE